MHCHWSYKIMTILTSIIIQKNMVYETGVVNSIPNMDDVKTGN
jgi:hypothetical protein